MNSPAEIRVRQLADCQHGLVTRHQALAAGLSRRMIEVRLCSGLWKGVMPGVYALPGHTRDNRFWLAAATLCLPGAVVSHQSAAALHGIPGVPPKPSVTVRYCSTHSFPGVVVHQSTDLGPDDVVVVDSLPVTALVRTVIDLAAVLSSRRLEAVVDESLAAGLVTLPELSEALATVARRGKRGIRALRTILEQRGPGYVPPQSRLERRFLEVIDGSGLPAPVRQMEAPWRTILPERVDFAYPQARLVIEVDGRRWHARYLDHENDRRRDNLATLAGWKVLRFSWEQVTQQPDEVGATVMSVLRMEAVG